MMMFHCPFIAGHILINGLCETKNKHFHHQKGRNENLLDLCIFIHSTVITRISKLVTACK